MNAHLLHPAALEDSPDGVRRELARKVGQITIAETKEAEVRGGLRKAEAYCERATGESRNAFEGKGLAHITTNLQEATLKLKWSTYKRK